MGGADITDKMRLFSLRLPPAFLVPYYALQRI